MLTLNRIKAWTDSQSTVKQSSFQETCETRFYAMAVSRLIFNEWYIKNALIDTEEFSARKISSGEYSAGEFTTGEFDEGEFSAGEFYKGGFSVGKFSAGEFSAG